MTTLYNAERYVKKCIDSMKMQNQPFKCYITDDISTDSSAAIVEKEIKDDPRFVLIKNSIKLYQPGNYYFISKLNNPDDAIVITLDGDDWFPDANVITRVKHYYSNPRILMHFGQFDEFNGSGTWKGFTKRPSDLRNIRRCGWSTSHLRTFKLGLFRQIREEDLRGPNGSFWECTGDMATMFPMIEMCSPDRIGFTEDINMIYNSENPLNDHKVNTKVQRSYDRDIRMMPRYPLLFP